MDKEQKREKYLLKKYGVTLSWYNTRLEKQGGGCAICGSKPVTRSLPVDHDHKVVKYKIKAVKALMGGVDLVWFASIPQLSSPDYIGWTKREAVSKARRLLTTMASRGVICFGCNTGLRKFRDNPVFLRNAAEYLENFAKELSVK